LTVESWRTAISRKKLSKPVQIYRHELMGRILNYGSGRGEDTEFLRVLGYDIYNYDKYFPSDADLLVKYDTIICNYVLNVISTIDERIEVLLHIKQLLNENGYAYITVRPFSELRSIKTSVKYNDGIITSKNTFQKFYEKGEITAFLGNYFSNTELINTNPLIIKVS
jgi:DNA phosphorothioation-associated putative methyltransferase